MPTDKELDKLILNIMTEDQYAAATKNADELYLTPLSDTDGLPAVPTDKTESYYLNATYDSVSQKSSVAWSALKKTYRHFVKLSGTDGTYEGELYITITSTNGLVINNLTDFDTVMTNFVGTVECSGYYTENLNDGYPIIRLMWERNFSYISV